MEYIDFGLAIRAVKDGYKIAREGWNGKLQYVTLGKDFSYRASNNDIVNPTHLNIGGKALIFHGTSGEQVGWLASQADMLAEDWYIVGREI